MSKSAIASTHNDAAITALDTGIRSFNGWRIDALDHIDRAIESDPNYVLAQTVKGLVLLGARHTRFSSAVELCLNTAKSGLDRASEYERQMTESLDLAFTGKVIQGVEQLRQILTNRPTDLFVHRIVQQELFWMGEAALMRDIAERALPAWSDEHTDYGGYLSVLAFALEEAGDHARAEDYGRQAVALDNQDCWGTHAVAHVLEMQHRSRDGIDWLQGLSNNWQDSNIIKHHLWWHLCLFLLEHEAHDDVIELLTSQVRNEQSPLVQALPDAYIDIQNVASILLRLELRGVDVKSYWQPIADFCAERVDNHLSPFTSAHAAMVLAAVGRFDDAEKLIDSMREFVALNQHDLAPRFEHAAIPAARAAIAHRRQDYQAVVDILEPVQDQLWRMGGSHAQRDVFTQLLFDACRRLNLKDLQQSIIAGLASSGFSHGAQRTLYRH